MTKKCKLIAAVLVCLLGVGGTFTLESAQVNAASLTDAQEQYFSQMESNHKSMMKQAVESGRLTKDQAEQMNANVDQHMKNMKEYASNNPDSYMMGNGQGMMGYGPMMNGYGPMMMNGYGMMGANNTSNYGPGMMMGGYGPCCR